MTVKLAQLVKKAISKYRNHHSVLVIVCFFTYICICMCLLLFVHMSVYCVCVLCVTCAQVYALPWGHWRIGNDRDSTLLSF